MNPEARELAFARAKLVAGLQQQGSAFAGLLDTAILKPTNQHIKACTEFFAANISSESKRTATLWSYLAIVSEIYRKQALNFDATDISTVKKLLSTGVGKSGSRGKVSQPASSQSAAQSTFKPAFKSAFSNSTFQKVQDDSKTASPNEKATGEGKSAWKTIAPAGSVAPKGSSKASGFKINLGTVKKAPKPAPSVPARFGDEAAEPEPEKGLSAIKKQLHILYLISDLLHYQKFHSRCEKYDDYILEVEDLTIQIVGSIVNTDARGSTSHFTKFNSLFDLWETNQFFPFHVIHSFRSQIYFAKQRNTLPGLETSPQPWTLPPTHGDPSDLPFHLPASNAAKLLSVRPGHPIPVKALRPIPFPSSVPPEELVERMKQFDDAVSLVQSHEEINVDPVGGPIEGMTYYGFSKQFAERLREAQGKGQPRERKAKEKPPAHLREKPMPSKFAPPSNYSTVAPPKSYSNVAPPSSY